MKEKEPVRLREKALKDGGTSLYLDVYANGVRRYEFLRLYLVPECSPADRKKNRQTMELAMAAKARRTLELRAEVFGASAEMAAEVDFIEYMLAVVRRRQVTEGTMESWRSAAAAVRRFCGHRQIKLTQVTAMWLRDFGEWLRRNYERTNTRVVYMSKVRSALRRAVRDGLLRHNPAEAVDVESMEDSVREYLTAEEVRRLASTPAPNETIRRAFLFGCLTGLRYSDIMRLTYDMVTPVGSSMGRIVFRQKKTRGIEYLDISSQAMSLIGGGAAGASIFGARPRTLPTMDRWLRNWVEAAGIRKHITFHCARHTFAVLMLDAGVDIYTVSKLLGHRNIATTQIYAHMLDKNKQAAVQRLPDLLGG